MQSLYAPLLRALGYRFYAVIFVLCVAGSWLHAQATDALVDLDVPQYVKLGEGRMQMLAPENWKRKKPRTNIVQYEFAIPSTNEDDAPARLTIMSAGGGVKANVTRWLGQFQTADGKAVENAADPAESQVAGQTVHWVDLSGTYADSPRGPFGPKTNRPGYRMLSAIIATSEQGQYFVKCYGPANTVAAAEKSFKGFVQSLKLLSAADSDASEEKTEK